MGILIVLLIVCTFAAVTKVVLRAERARPATRPHSPRVRGQVLGARAASSTRLTTAWSALDDLQLTRLLTDSARRNSSEQP